MNILHILDERWDSGLTAFGLTLAGVEQRRGHRVWVAARPGSPAARAAVSGGLFLLPGAGTLTVRRCVVTEKIDVVNGHTGSGHSVGFFATRGTPTALVRTRAEARRLKPRWGQGALYRRTDAVVAASQTLGDAYRSVYPFLKERLSVVFPAVEIPAFSEAPDGPLRVGLVGRLDPVKGHHVLLAAAERLLRLGLGEIYVVAGEEKNVRRLDLMAEAARRGLADRVVFLGRVDDVGSLMATCAVGVVASVGSEAVSRVALEWMARGRPLVASRVGALPELVRHGETGFLVPPKDANALAQAVSELLVSKEKRKAFGRAAHTRALEQFSFERLGLDMERVYAAAQARRRKTSL